MARGNIYAGIDVGTCKVTTILVSEDEETGKQRVVGVASEESRGIRKSQVVDIEEAIEAITSSVEAAERMAGFSITHAYISIGGSHIQSQNSKGVVAVANSGEEITAEDVGRVIEAARAVSLPSSREILHVIPRDFIVDSQGGIKDPMSMTGVRLEVDAHIITGSSTSVRNLVKCISEIGIHVSGLVFSGLAASESVLTETEKELGVCLIDIGGGSTNLAVFIEGSLTYSGVLPIGAKHITNDLAIGLRVNLEEAEKIKLALSNHSQQELLKDASKDSDLLDLGKFGITQEMAKPSYKTLVDGIIRPRLNEIYGMVGDELKKADLLAATPAGVVLSGGGALTIRAADACKRTLSLPVRVSETGEERSQDLKLSGLIDDLGSPRFAVCKGLIYYAVSQNGASVSSRLSLPRFSDIVQKFPGKGLLRKGIDFFKSFLP